MFKAFQVARRENQLGSLSSRSPGLFEGRRGR
jgi:hypothetical protein